MKTTTTFRPLTSALTSAQVTCALCMSPALPAEHLVQAWDAIEASDRGEKQAANLAFAANRAACVEAIVVGSRKPRLAAKALAEAAQVRAAIAVRLAA